MKYSRLGRTGLNVSRLCFGALTVGPLQSDMTPEAGADVLLHALESGINFIDTAEIYKTYAHCALAVKKFTANGGARPVIATKCYAYTREGARDSLEMARRELDCDVIDIFMLHEQESRLTLRGHLEASDYFVSQKAAGRIRAFGISTHNIEVVDACADLDYVDVISPIVNISGLGIGDGSIEEMLSAVRKAGGRGKGIYSMKPLGGGNLLHSFDECIGFVTGIPYISSVAMGMQSRDEVDCNVALFEGRTPSDELKQRLSRKGMRSLHVDQWCTVCGKCVKRCAQKALCAESGKIEVDRTKCLMCGYCAGVCPEFALKIF